MGGGGRGEVGEGRGRVLLTFLTWNMVSEAKVGKSGRKNLMTFSLPTCEAILLMSYINTDKRSCQVKMRSSCDRT